MALIWAGVRISDGVDPAAEFAHVAQVMGQIDDAALAQHDVEVEVLAQTFVKLQRLLIDGGAFVPQIVGPDDRRVAARVAAAEPSFLDHRDVANTVFLGQIIGGRQTMAAGADDNHFVFRLRLRTAPGGRPIAMVIDRVAGKAEDRITAHDRGSNLPAI